MCGIAGYLAGSRDGRADAETLLRMSTALVHRGPDGGRIWTGGAAGLAHRRLAIIDLSERGSQPMTSEDGSVVLVANGEIYNHRALRSELEGRGHRFRSDSDNEVILHLYEELGSDTPTRLRGMFAYALWDSRRGRLQLARDRMGQKPLYWTLRPDGLAFASEIGALLADPRTDADLAPAALDAYLALQYVPHPWTIFRAIHSLPPGSVIEVGCGETPAPRRYWEVSSAPIAVGAAEAAARVRAAVEDAVRVRMMSDVPLGAFLSGGVDSSVVVACMARASNAPVKTFSIGFDRREDSELDYARLVARRWNTEHHEQIVRPDMLGVLPRLARHHGQPFGDPSALPTHYLSEMTRRHVVVALSGDAGDETFGGYRRYVWGQVADRILGLPAPLRASIGAALRATPTGPGRWVREYGRQLAAGEASRYLSFICHFTAADKQAIYDADLARQFQVDRTAERFAEMLAASRAGDAVGRFMDLDLHTYLPDDILAKVDIASMTHSLEARSPFCDHPVVELAASLPSSLKLRGLRGKWLLKRAFADLVPAAILHRKKKGFSLPLRRWFRGELRDPARDLLLGSSARSRGLFRVAAVEQLIDRHQAGEDHGDRLWNLLALEVWFREMVDGRARLVADVSAQVADATRAAQTAAG